MLLQAGNDIFKYCNYDELLQDSTLHANIQSGMNPIDAMNEIFKSAKKMNDRSEIFKNYPANKITYSNFFAAQTYLYEEEQLVPEWELLQDTATVLGYLCRKATCVFRCRTYEAWYAPDIPIAGGPWKFSGLPGLILKVYDEKKEFQFEAVAIEKTEWKDPITITKSKNAMKTTKQNYLKAYKNYMSNPAVAIQAVDPNLQLPATPKSRPYNPIELCE
jgi:GLPGLI family protein